jgi:hypothetical protein
LAIWQSKNMWFIDSQPSPKQHVSLPFQPHLIRLLAHCNLLLKFCHKKIWFSKGSYSSICDQPFYWASPIS